VLAEIGAGNVAEQLVINKIDRADATTLAGLRTRYPDAVFVSARTGEGIDDLTRRVEERLPRPAVEVNALVPYARGDLIDKIHTSGEIMTLEHTADGTAVTARVNRGLAGELAPFTRE
jgi:GTP-binding protein HflX